MNEYYYNFKNCEDCFSEEEAINIAESVTDYYSDSILYTENDLYNSTYDAQSADIQRGYFWEF